MFYRWRRMEEEDRGRVWRLYGWFTALMACGSCVGAVAWTADMMVRVNLFKGNASEEDPAQVASLFVLVYSWQAAFLVTYAIEFLCLSAAKLMVLDRMAVFAAPQGARLQKLWASAGRVVMAVVVLGNAAGLAANAAAAVHYHKAAEAQSTASAYYAANNSNSGDDFQAISQQEVQLGGSIAAVQSFCEVAVLLLIVVAFAVVGVLSARRVSARLLGVDAASAAAATGRALRRRMLGTTAFVFVTFVLRAAFSTMYAVAFQFRATVDDKFCPGSCDECANVYVHITGWMTYTPEFQLLIVLVSSPVALLVALWSMTSNATLYLMKSSQREALLSLTPVKSVLRK
jgi:hypothetical protein